MHPRWTVERLKLEIWQAFSGLVGGLCIGLIGVAWTRLPQTPVRPPLYAFLVSGILWAVGDLIATGASDTTSKLIGVVMLYTGTISMPALWWIVALRWAKDVDAGLSLRASGWQQGPLWWAGGMWLVMITNPWHGAFLTPVVGGRNIYEPLWYAMALPNYGLILAALVVEIEVMRRVARREVRHQAGYLIAASSVTLVFNWMYVSGLVQLNGTVVTLSTSCALLFVGMAREGLFGVLPAALSAIAARHPDGLVVVGPGGCACYANGRAHELLAPFELTPNARVLEAFRPVSPPGEIAEPSNLESDERWWERLTRPEGLTLRVTGGSRWLDLSATPVHGRGRGELGHCLRISDATARRQAELRARQAHRLESVASLARTVSRDFQGVFEIVRGNAELLAGEVDCDPASQRRLSRIVEATSYGSELAQQLQLYTGSVDTARVSLELSQIVEETCELADSDLPAGVAVLCGRSGPVLPIEADPIQIRHCIFNLLVNAIEATGIRGGEVLVSTGERSFDPSREGGLVSGSDAPPGDFAYVRIADDGGGMEPEAEERAFEPFFSTRGKDRGNGLPTVLGIAKAHGAPVALANEPGRGCTFTVYFPIVRA
jgi:signal transduction histidine kinase